MALLAPPAPANAPPRPREVFLPGDSRRQSRLGALRRRLHWPLGIYTTPVVILIVWEILAQAGILKPAYAPAPTDILTTTVELWRDGVLGTRSGDLLAASGNWSCDRVEPSAS